MVAHTPHLTFSYLLRGLTSILKREKPHFKNRQCYARRRKMDFIKNLDWQLIYTVVFRTLLAVIVGALIGSERAKHGRAAGMRTHILVCLGAMLTSLTGIYAIEHLGNEGDMLTFRRRIDFYERIHRRVRTGYDSICI